jgi:FkbM family methyltransferase
MLRANLPHNVTVHDIGAWNYETILTFTRFADSAHMSSFFKEEGINTGPKVGTVDLRCCAIDSLGISQTVDFLKCDIEGAEIECLLGAEQLILRDRPWLFVETHSSGNFISLVRLLASWEYLFTIIRHPDYEPFSRLWFEHCWFSCQPSLEQGALQDRFLLYNSALCERPSQRERISPPACSDFSRSVSSPR